MKAGAQTFLSNNILSVSPSYATPTLSLAAADCRHSFSITSARQLANNQQQLGENISSKSYYE